MSIKHMGGQTVHLQSPPTVAAFAAVAGKLEGEGPLGKQFDFISEDSYFGEASWEKAESAMLKQCFSMACDKGQLAPSPLDYLFAGDLLNKCSGTATCPFSGSTAPAPPWRRACAWRR